MEGNFSARHILIFRTETDFQRGKFAAGNGSSRKTIEGGPAKCAYSRPGASVRFNSSPSEEFADVTALSQGLARVS